ncbi:hypothetical protein [Georgenia sp. SUBG003]|uniref:hypothetical protein n=1 Tax=Georgenia sp. SUBG003 TaxID=1497974 RepID=UPI003AB6F896
MATTASVPSTTTPVYQDQIVTSGAARKALAAGRIVIGWTFLWAFLDKLLGLGYMTPRRACLDQRRWSVQPGPDIHVAAPFGGIKQSGLGVRGCRGAGGVPAAQVPLRPRVLVSPGIGTDMAMLLRPCARIPHEVPAAPRTWSAP